MKMILMDCKGDKIQVSVKRDEFNQWREHLIENTTYVMHNFNVFHNDLQFKTCSHAYRMQFIVDTTIKDKDFSDIPQFEYVFKKFSEILAGNFQTDLLVDIVGVVDKMIFSQTQTSLKKVILNLRDSRYFNVH
ncbi:putative nucleic acid-binding protein [Lupinus albus]|uniref:Putative nucleic acid-binding protein n=1 Tax=Lupinus albus TaxID=3870 RepID=A0A6A4PSL6_LUPAL|nr:putative nucleic acid-binding protein [Lupinus albus]